MTPEQRFWAKVERGAADACWQWTGYRDRKGYGRMRWGYGRKAPLMLTHRISFVLFNDEIPADMLVCHRCDNPPCVNPAHLFLGTNKDNCDDRDAKGRNVSHAGEGNGSAKLTEADVLRIRERCANGDPLAVVAEDYNVSETLISFIRLRKTWRHVGGPASVRRPAVSVGSQFDRLTVIAPEAPRILGRKTKHAYAMWRVQCACGNERVVRADSLTGGETKSCGCIRREQIAARNRA